MGRKNIDRELKVNQIDIVTIYLGNTFLIF